MATAEKLVTRSFPFVSFRFFVDYVNCSREGQAGRSDTIREECENACGNWTELRQVRDPARRGRFSLIAEREREKKREEHVSLSNVSLRHHLPDQTKRTLPLGTARN